MDCYWQACPIFLSLPYISLNPSRKSRHFRAVHIFLRWALDAQKFDVSQNYYDNRINRINWYVCENSTTLALGIFTRAMGRGGGGGGFIIFYL